MKATLRWLDIAVFLALAVFAAVSPPRTASWLAGMCLAVVAAVPWFVARWQLGASFAVTAQARELVTTGLYSKLRHPVYVFGSLAWLGVVIALVGPRAIAAWIFVMAIQLLRVRHEERVLAEAFGAQYDAYRKTTWF